MALLLIGCNQASPPDAIGPADLSNIATDAQSADVDLAPPTDFPDDSAITDDAFHPTDSVAFDLHAIDAHADLELHHDLAQSIDLRGFSCPALAAPPSCNGGLTCAGGDCCASECIPGGTFNRSNLNSYPATVSDFRLDRFEVTVGRFRKFVNAGMGTQTSAPAAGAGAHAKIGPSSGWQSSWNSQLASNTSSLIAALTYDNSCSWPLSNAGSEDDLPITCVDWYEAFAFCIWDGGYLPTEAEWNDAAAGGSEQRLYPWGSATPDATYAAFSPNGLTSPRRVGTDSPQGDGRWGQADLAGNAGEWVLDAFGGSFTTYSSSVCSDCADLSATTERVVRGGSWQSDAKSITSAVRDGNTPPSSNMSTGFRCARPL